MIPLEFRWIISIYLLVFLAAVFLVWVGYEMARIHRESHSLRHRLRCTICGMEYEDRTSTLLPRCPRCGSLNERLNIGGY